MFEVVKFLFCFRHTFMQLTFKDIIAPIKSKCWLFGMFYIYASVDRAVMLEKKNYPQLRKVFVHQFPTVGNMYPAFRRTMID